MNRRAFTPARSACATWRAKATRADVASPGERSYLKKDAWRFVNNELSWRGYVGTWHVNAHDPQTAHSLTGLRTWKWRDEGRAVWEQLNVYDVARPGTSAREVDGLHEKAFTYPVNRATFEDPATASPGTMLTTDAGGLALLGGSRLPPIALDGAAAAAAAAAAAPGAPGGAAPPGGMWGMELILMDGDCRWGLAVLYDAVAGGVERVTLIQEYTTASDPATPNVLAACGSTIQEPRPALDASQAAAWVAPRGPAGRRVSRLRAAAGGALLLSEGLDEAVAWEGPVGGGASGRLLLPLPDAMYLAVPASLKGAAGTGRAAPCAFEFGGLLRGAGGGLQRLLVRYSGGEGALVDVSREVFAAT